MATSLKTSFDGHRRQTKHIPLLRLHGVRNRNDELSTHKPYSSAHLCFPCLRVCQLHRVWIPGFNDIIIMSLSCRSDRSRHVEAHHFCTHRSTDFHQCIIYDSGELDARLIGIEYIVSEKVRLPHSIFWHDTHIGPKMFKDLPQEEKKYWHSHKYEVCIYHRSYLFTG